jgi:hypothetical protein
MKKIKLIHFVCLITFIFFISCTEENKTSTIQKIPLQIFFEKIEKSINEFEKLNFSYYSEDLTSYSFEKDSIGTIITYKKDDKVEIYNKSTKSYCELKDLPDNYFKTFSEIKNVSQKLNVNKIFFEKVNKDGHFFFDLKYIKQETIPKWDKRNDDKIEKYEGVFIYSIDNLYINDSSYYKIKDKWYFWYGIRRAD